MSAEPIPLRQWRVTMKTGETWVVTADRLDPIPSLGLSFSVAGATTAVVPFGTFSACEEIAATTEDTPGIRKLPAPDDAPGSETKTKRGGGGTKTKMIRTTEAANDYYNENEGEDDDVVRLILAIDCTKPEGEPLKEVRASFLEIVGGFPPKTYKRFNDALAAAVEDKFVELFEV